jgi:hypothetical protein
MIREYVEFLDASTRGICHGRGKAARGTAAVS